jgi:predicted phage-related endonuclease
MKPASFQFPNFVRHEPKRADRARLGYSRNDHRLRGIGASEVPILAGLSAFATPKDLYERKTNRELTFDQSEAMRIGTHFEKPFFEYLRKYHFGGMTLQRNTGIYVHENAPHFCTPDGYANSMLHTKPDLLELKISSYFSRKKCDAAAAQCQYTMHLLGLDTAYICVLQGTKVDLIKVPYSASEGEKLVELARDFWNGCVLAGKSP